MELVTGMAIVKTVGVDVTLQCLSSVTSSAKGIYNMISSIKTNDELLEVMRFIEKEDIEKQTKMVEAILTGVNIEKHHTSALSQCVSDLKECLSTMETLLSAINVRANYNRSIWMFKSFRSYGFSDLFNRLQICTQNLAYRKQALFDVLRINNQLEAA
jgi:hypothetical protein